MKKLIVLAVLLALVPASALGGPMPSLMQSFRLAFPVKNTDEVLIGGTGTIETGTGTPGTKGWKTGQYVSVDARDGIFTTDTKITKIKLLLPTAGGVTYTSFILSVWRPNENGHLSTDPYGDFTRQSQIELLSTPTTMGGSSTEPVTITVPAPYISTTIGDFGGILGDAATPLSALQLRSTGWLPNQSLNAIVNSRTATTGLVDGGLTGSWPVKFYGPAAMMVAFGDCGMAGLTAWDSLNNGVWEFIAGGAYTQSIMRTYNYTFPSAYHVTKPFGWNYAQMGATGRLASDSEATIQAQIISLKPRFCYYSNGINNFWLFGGVGNPSEQTIANIQASILAGIRQTMDWLTAAGIVPVVAPFGPVGAVAEETCTNARHHITVINRAIGEMVKAYPGAIWADTYPSIGTYDSAADAWTLRQDCAEWPLEDAEALSALGQQKKGEAVASAIYHTYIRTIFLRGRSMPRLLGS